MQAFQQELETYREVLPTMLQQAEGQYVVIRGTRVCKVLPSYEDALEWAYGQFGLEPFFVKQISSEEPIAHFSRDLGPCAA